MKNIILIVGAKKYSLPKKNTIYFLQIQEVHRFLGLFFWIF